MRTLQEEGKRLKEVAENEMVRRFEMSSELQAMQRQLQSAVPSARSERRDERAEVEHVRSEWRESEGEQLGGAVKVSCEGEEALALAKQRRQAVEAVLDGPAPATAPATAPLGTGASPGPGAVAGAGGVGSGARLGYLSRAYSSTIRNRVPN